jgi:hypothetical protein
VISVSTSSAAVRVVQHDEGDQTRVGPGAVGHHGRLTHAGQPQRSALDLARFDPEATDLDLDTLARVPGVDGDVGRAGEDDGGDRDDEVGGPIEQDGDAVAGPQPAFVQQGGDAQSPVAEFSGEDDGLAADDGRPVRVGFQAGDQRGVEAVGGVGGHLHVGRPFWSLAGGDQWDEAGGQLAHRRVVEEHLHVEVEVQFRLQPAGEPHGAQGVAAQFEEVVVEADFR